jgi:hypothetical protein
MPDSPPRTPSAEETAKMSYDDTPVDRDRISHRYPDGEIVHYVREGGEPIFLRILAFVGGMLIGAGLHGLFG